MMLCESENFNYDDKNYYADVQRCYDGTEAHPEFTNRHSLPKNNENTLREELQKIGLPVQVICKADEIYNKLRAGTKRGRRRKQMMFFCVKSAFNELGMTEDPVVLAEMCGVSRSDISKAQSMCARTKSNYKAPIVSKVPSDFIKTFFKKIENSFNFSDGVLEEILDICEEVMENDEDLYDEKPQTVAAAIIVFYLEIHSEEINKKEYREIFGSSDMTINKIKDKVEQAYND